MEKFSVTRAEQTLKGMHWCPIEYSPKDTYLCKYIKKTTSMINMRYLAMLTVLLPTAGVVALVPHQFWNRHEATKCKLSPSKRNLARVGLSMYFDDRERFLDIEEMWNKFSFDNSLSHVKNNQWISSLSEEKHLALERFLGYNLKSASNLSDEKIEEETLRWAVDTNFVSGEYDDDEQLTPEKLDHSDKSKNYNSGRQQRLKSSKYDIIKDLQVSSSNSTLQSLSFLWDGVFCGTELRMQLNKIFPRSKHLWDYDIMVTMLEAIQISKPLLPSQFDLHLDLFHPDYKHSPRMWSPEFHSPFPTVGISINTKNNNQPIDEIDIDTIRGKLDALFRSTDATREHIQNSADEDHEQVLKKCQKWLLQVERQRKESQQVVDLPTSRKCFDESNIDWTVQTRRSPFQLYKTIWNSILTLSTTSSQNCSAVIIEPFLDSYTLHRVAVTVNAALKRLDISVRITEVYHPDAKPPSSNSETITRPPYSMIQLSPLCRQ
ncbi:hypothetical protein FRACYDRAFT_234172 [Fragilariopsis cylindrus CCMP1102]|uniref:Uncharacterized protein n=1 Tax=Fragilariopsis cylindrus CCMP1102 TaxID=635003 RepID=A0A1E7FR01_9STRA|nr:hypothetical protein FRACYDRAFT_234172 [Fragilariopsis cylindrus CCMP1102]|eukprot:OEU20544.1 hypothetical protein FRACYDRAFT_234172 [Fragilariopsis cylindrus CCMP1102]